MIKYYLIIISYKITLFKYQSNPPAFPEKISPPHTDTNGQEYMIYNTGHDYAVIWDNGEYVFEISDNLSKNELLDLCRSTKVKEI